MLRPSLLLVLLAISSATAQHNASIPQPAHQGLQERNGLQGITSPTPFPWTTQTSGTTEDPFGGTTYHPPSPTWDSTDIPPTFSDCCVIDLSDLKVVLSEGVADRTGSGCYSLSCPSSITIQRELIIDWELIARQFGLTKPKVKCADAARLGLVKSFELERVLPPRKQ